MYLHTDSNRSLARKLALTQHRMCERCSRGTGVKESVPSTGSWQWELTSTMGFLSAAPPVCSARVRSWRDDPQNEGLQALVVNLAAQCVSYGACSGPLPTAERLEPDPTRNPNNGECRMCTKAGRHKLTRHFVANEAKPLLHQPRSVMQRTDLRNGTRIRSDGRQWSGAQSMQCDASCCHGTHSTSRQACNASAEMRSAALSATFAPARITFLLTRESFAACYFPCRIAPRCWAAMRIIHSLHVCINLCVVSEPLEQSCRCLTLRRCLTLPLGSQCLFSADRGAAACGLQCKH